MVRRYFLAWCVVTSCLVSGQPLTYGLHGQTFHLTPDITGQPDEILWTHNGNKVVEFDGKEEQVYDQNPYRVTLDWVTAELDITDLRYEDSGDYELEAYGDKQLHQFHYKLQVIDRVPKPTISCDLSDGSSNTNGTQATLTCSANPTPSRSIMKYEWHSRGNVLPGPTLTINVEDEHADHTCMVSNPLTKETAAFSSKSCFTDEGPSTALIASLVPIFIVLIAVALAIVFCRLRRKACFAKKPKDVEQQIPPGTLEELTPLCNQASTLPSHQRLNHFQGGSNVEASANGHKDMDTGNEHGEDQYMDLQDETPQKGPEENTDEDQRAKSSPSPLGRKPSFCEGQDNVTSKYNGDGDEDEFRRNSGNDSEAEPDPAGVLDFSKDTKSDVESFPEQPESEEAEEENEEAKSPPANGIFPPTADTCPPLTQNSPDMTTEEGANSDQVNGETAEENVRESHSTDSVKSTESGNFSEEEPLSSTPEQRGSDTALHEQDSNVSQDEMLTCKDNQQDMDKTVPVDESESDHESNMEDIEKEEDLYLDTSQQPHQSPIQTETGDSKTDLYEEPLNTDHESEQELGNIGRHSPEESDQQPACSVADSEKGEGEGTLEENKKDECGPKEGKTGSRDPSENREREINHEIDD